MVALVPARLPARRPEELNARQRDVYEAITRGRRADGPRLFETTGPQGELLGPFAAMVAHPVVGEPLQRLGEALRYETSLPTLAREVVILAVAAHHRSEYEWYAHAAVARHAGIAPDVIEALRGGCAPPGVDDPALLAWRLAQLMLQHEHVPDDVFAAVRSALGTTGIVEVTALVGYYSLLAQLIDVFELTPPEGSEPAFGG
jgi:4-carboxymuconolactone decarboxylase